MARNGKRYAVITDGLYLVVEANTDNYIEALEIFIELYMSDLNGKAYGVYFYDGNREYNPLVED